MSDTFLDTLSIAKKLMHYGFNQQQAEGQTLVFKKIIEEQEAKREKELEAKQLATNGDIQKAIKELELKIKASEIKIIYWIIGLFFALTGFMVTLFQIFK